MEETVHVRPYEYLHDCEDGVRKNGRRQREYQYRYRVLESKYLIEMSLLNMSPSSQLRPVVGRPVASLLEPFVLNSQ